MCIYTYGYVRVRVCMRLMHGGNNTALVCGGLHGEDLDKYVIPCVCVYMSACGYVCVYAFVCN